MVSITLIYAGILGLMMAVLSFRVPQRRFAKQVSWGHGDDAELDGRIRVFGNFTEYVPAILILLALLEISGAENPILHGLGIVLVAARLFHAVSLRPGRQPKWRRLGRVLGAGSTWLVLIFAAGYGLLQSLTG